jgi:hypothetical protein
MCAAPITTDNGRSGRSSADLVDELDVDDYELKPIAEAMERMSIDDGEGGRTIDVNHLAPDDVYELLRLIQDLARRNGQMWTVVAAHRS